MATAAARKHLKTVDMGEAMTGAGQWATNWKLLQWNPSDLVGKRGLYTFDAMLRDDDQIKAAVTFKREAVLATGWKVEPPPDMPPTWAPNAFINRRLEAMGRSFEMSLRDMLTATVYGYSITEKIFELVQDGEDAGMIGVRGLKTRAPHFLRFNLDEFGNVIEIKNDQDNKTYDVNKFLVWSYNSSFGNPYGISDLETCYRAFCISNNSYKWLSIYLERLGIPPMIAFFNPEGLKQPGQERDVQTVLKNSQNATSAMIPRAKKDDFEIWTPGVVGNVQSVFIPALEHLKKDMARALLMPGLMGVTPDEAGSLARARVSLEMFLLHLTSVQAELGQIIQKQLIEPWVALNFDTGGVYPKFSFMPLNEEDAQSVLQTWATMVDRDIVSVDADDEAHVRSLLRFPKREADDATEGADDSKRARIPLRFLDKLQNAVTKDEVRSTMGLDPLPTDGDKLVSEGAEPPAAPPPVADPPPDDGTEPPAPGGGGAPPPGQDEPKPPVVHAEGSFAERYPFDPFAEPNPITEDDIVVTENPRPPEPDDPGLTPVERRCDFAAISSGLDAIDADTTQAVAAAVRKAVYAQLDAWLKRPPTLARVGKVKITVSPTVRTAMQKGLKAALKRGRADAAAEAAKAPAKFAEEDLPTYDPVAAITYLETKADLYVAGLTDKITSEIREELLVGLRNGLPFTETRNRLLERLAPWVGAPDVDPKALQPDRLLTTVRTNATDAYNHGRVVEARRLGSRGLVTGMQHSSVLDTRTTPICRSLQGRCYKIGSPDLDRFTPPLHFRCLVGGTIVTTNSAVAATSHREYRGEIVSIRTSGGRQLAGTPNHPVLTDRGWVHLGALDERDRIICRAVRQGTVAVEVDHQHVPTRIEDMATAPLSAGGVVAVMMPTAAEDFHGDGSGSEVCVVVADRLLWRRLHATRAKHLLELLLEQAAMVGSRIGLPRLRYRDPVSVALFNWAVPHGVMRSLSDLHAAFWSELRHAQSHGLAVPAHVDARLAQAVEDWRYGHAERCGDALGWLATLVPLHQLLDREIQLSLQRLSGLLQPSEKSGETDAELAAHISRGLTGPVETDQVTSIEREPCYHGSVHNLETVSGHYTADGIIVQNCRSILLPITLDIDISDDPAEEFHWITPEELAEAKRNTDGRFGGDYEHKKANAPKG